MDSTTNLFHTAPLPVRLPKWLHRPMFRGNTYFETSALLDGLPTVCEEAKCPNRMECFSKKTATFLLLGSECTRACGFCEIGFSKTPKPPAKDEPMRVARSVHHLGLRHVVLTMVARDDLSDGGAAHVVSVMEAIRKVNPGITIETLSSDFAGNTAAWNTLLSANPEIVNYNIETVRRLTPSVRHKATYERTLAFLRHAKPRLTKSGLMLGLGETQEEVEEALHDLKEAGVAIVTIGQYLRPSKKKLVVKAYIPPEQFQYYETYGHSIGIPHVYSGPFVRSSHNAEQILQKIRDKGYSTSHGSTHS